MSVNTFLPGRLVNTKLPARDGLLPLFEAVVNAIHAIDDSKIGAERGEIKIVIERGPQNLEFYEEEKKRGRDALPPIINIIIQDNGIGLDEQNMNAFSTLDTDNKRDRGGKGIGRLLWLKAFDHVHVKSTFTEDDGKYRTRDFSFVESSGIVEASLREPDPENAVRGTTISLIGFREAYRKAVFKSCELIARATLEHCLWYFLRSGGAPAITFEDAAQSITLQDIYDQHMHSIAQSDSLSVKDQQFELLHIKLRADSTSAHRIAYCADMRLVKSTKIDGKIPGLYGSLVDDRGEFYYSCYVSSNYLDAHTRSERTAMDIAEDFGELFEESELTWKDIEKAVTGKIAGYLDEYLEAGKKRVHDRVNCYVSTKAPRYRSIVPHIPPDDFSFDPEISDRELELILHKHFATFEQQLLADGQELMKPLDDENQAEYQKRLEDYLLRAEELKKSDLAGYVFHRKVIIDLLELAIVRGEDGKYKREDLLHTFIMPMRKDSNEVRFESCNLWLVDERLAFHDYLASDKTLASMPITDSKDGKEPDLLALNVFDNPILVSEGRTLPTASIVVVEIKRPMRNDAAADKKHDPVQQSLDYLERIRSGRVLTSTGRNIPNSDRIPGFCYVISDLTDTVVQRCKFAGLARSSDGMSYFGYNPEMMAYIEVISYAGLVSMAKQRNRSFFDRLGLPAS